MNSEGMSEFIEIYRDNFCLWDSSSALYANRNVRRTAQEQLLNVLLKYEKNANLVSVRKKVESLRAMFFREHKKMQASESGRGTGADDVYVPNWVHYNDMSFLSEVQRPARAVTDSLDTPSSVSSLATNGSELKENDGEVVEDYDQIAEKVDGDIRHPLLNVIKKRKSAQKELIAAAQKLAEVPAAAPPDKWESFALSVAEDLRALKDDKQHAIAQKLISDAVFWAKMGRLTEESSISLAPSTSTIPTTSVASFPYHMTSSTHSLNSYDAQNNPSPYYPTEPFDLSL